MSFACLVSPSKPAVQSACLPLLNHLHKVLLMEHAQGARPEALTPALLDHMAILHTQMHTLGEQYAKTYNIKSEKAALRETSVTDELLKNTA
jgi:hypothetical protein